MSELGRLLREARAAKDLSLADVESVTRIRQKYLEALESGQFAALPRGTVARGFLRTYAAYLGLDVPALIDLYNRESGDVGDNVPIAEPGKPRLVDYRPLEVELLSDLPSARWWPWVVALIAVVVLAAGGWWFLGRGNDWDPLAMLRPAAVPTATVTHTPTPWVVTATPQPSTTPSPTNPVPSPTSDLLPLPTPTVPASPTPTTRPSPTPELVAQISLELRSTLAAWVRITVDGQVAEEGMLQANDSRVYEANDSITVRTGNAGGVMLILNGEDLGLMGKVSEVVERSWAVAEGEVTETTAGVPTVTPTPTPAG